jgi:hypothetical protein
MFARETVSLLGMSVVTWDVGLRAIFAALTLTAWLLVAARMNDAPRVYRVAYRGFLTLLIVTAVGSGLLSVVLGRAVRLAVMREQIGQVTAIEARTLAHGGALDTVPPPVAFGVVQTVAWRAWPKAASLKMRYSTDTSLICTAQTPRFRIRCEAPWLHGPSE